MPKGLEPDSSYKFVILEGLKQGNRFFTSNGKEDPQVIYDGTLGYKIIGFANTVREAQVQLYGEDWVRRQEAWSKKNQR